MIKRLAGVITAAILCVPLAAAASVPGGPRHLPRSVTIGARHRSGSGSPFLGRLTGWRARFGSPAGARLAARAAAGRDGATSHPPRVVPAPTVTVGVGPNGLAADDATHTVYVANGGTLTPGHTVSVIDDRHCRATDISGCGQTPATVRAGSAPVGVALDHASHTLYVTNIVDGTVSVINTGTCNALRPAGCRRQHAPAFAVGNSPTAELLDARTGTLYVTNSGGDTISVINTATCNAHTMTNCAPVAAITVDAGPDYLITDPATRTLYALNAGTTTPGDTVSVISTAACNAHTTTGCAVAATVTVGPAPFGGDFDPASHTVYTANAGGNTNSGTVSLINTRSCNARHTAGCARPVPSFSPGTEPVNATVDPARHTVYVLNGGDDTLAALDTRSCNATRQSGCLRFPPTVQVGGFPEVAALDPASDTIYSSDVTDGTVSVVNPRTCHAGVTAGCRVVTAATRVGVFPNAVTLDPAVRTAYVSNDGGHTLTMINTRTCNAARLRHCRAVGTAVPVVAGPSGSALDPRSRTLYVTSTGPPRGAVTLLNPLRCNAASTRGCAPAFVIRPALPLVPVYLAVDAVNRTVYVLAYNINGSPTHQKNYLLMFSERACNAQHTAGCRAPLVKIPLGNAGGGNLLLDQATHSLYLSDLSFAAGTGDTITIINTATCSATRQSGCHPAATTTVGPLPFGLALDPATDTIYTANTADGDGPGTLSMINAATCNASHPAGCRRPWPLVSTPRNPLELAVDQASRSVLVADFADSTVAVINAARCNAAHPAGCPAAPPRFAVDSQPIAVAPDPSTHTAYITTGLNGLVSILRLPRP